jgi:microcystin degradation protein MlrC
MRRRVLIAGLFHETHTLVDEITGLDEFQVLRGAELLAREGDGSPLGGALETARRLDWEVVPTIDCRAQPSGTAADKVFESFWAKLQPQVEAAGGSVDAIYLVLHGAMVTTSQRDVEGELLRRLRKIKAVETLPIFGVFDLHANFSPAMAQYADCLVAYRENPHADACAAAVRAFELLDQHVRGGSRPRMFSRHAGIIWPPTGTGTADSPMKDLEEAARRIEREHPAMLAVNVVGGFAFSDAEDAGVSFSISTTGEEGEANAALDELCNLAWELRAAGNRRDPSFPELYVELYSLPTSGPIVIAEPSDNIGGGAPGDGTGLLRCLLQERAQNAAVCLCDPLAVAAFASLPIGSKLELPLGGRGSRLDAGPLTLEVELVSRSDGRFALEDRQSHLASMFGDHFDMGPCAVVRHRGVTILLTSIKTPPFDLGQWRSQGIIPEKLSVIGVKAAVAHRRAYLPIAGKMLTVDTPGPCRSDLTKLPYQHLRRPIYPLDE